MLGRESKAERDAAFTAFMTDATPSLLRTAWLLTGSHDRSQELVQAAFVKTYAAWPKVRREQALAYARRILVNHKTDTWRKTSREVIVDGVPERPIRPDSTVEHRDEILRMLDLLPAQQRRIVVLRYYQDLSEQQTADLLGISVGAVKSGASRGLATLRTAHLTTEGSQR
ncbi:SigE family RNA polymerase sigma factor [Knoellia sinensis]|uniref:SigE family RNA polymerase sigma factor n=1 Tax=Knoellia sinensis TaxID=136100 RepID=UPI00055E705B|nr:SigE family RNA polymerase sigma factor [Knoellia sinensis]